MDAGWEDADGTWSGAGQGVSGAGEPGDLLGIDAATGKATVLATADQLASLGSGAVNEKDRDHRDRYGMSAYFWQPDGKHLLLDQGGVLWLYDLAAAKATLIVDTHAGSGTIRSFLRMRSMFRICGSTTFMCIRWAVAARRR